MLKLLLCACISARRSREQLALENLALRHQLEVLQRNAEPPRLTPSDGALWAFLYRSLPTWRRHLVIVRPETVVRLVCLLLTLTSHTVESPAIPGRFTFVRALALSCRAYCRRSEGRNALELGGPRWAPELSTGVATGGGMVVLVVATLAAPGCYSVTSVNQPIVPLTRVFRYGMGSFVEELLFTIILSRLLEEFAGTVRA